MFRIQKITVNKTHCHKPDQNICCSKNGLINCKFYFSNFFLANILKFGKQSILLSDYQMVALPTKILKIRRHTIMVFPTFEDMATTFPPQGQLLNFS